jgi:hypothetical protein
MARPRLPAASSEPIVPVPRISRSTQRVESQQQPGRRADPASAAPKVPAAALTDTAPRAPSDHGIASRSDAVEPSSTLDLRPGEAVEVRSAVEILATLDEDGCLDGLPFMPEMERFCGRRFRVFKRADKTCDTIEWSGLRRLERTVHLEILRCDGSAHGGCQAGCLLFWKEAWLNRPSLHEDEAAGEAGGVSSILSERLASAAVVRPSPDGPEALGTVYRCQATQLLAASEPLPWWHPGQYFRDVAINGTPAFDVLRGLAISVINRVGRRFGLPTYPDLTGRLEQTPTESLGLQPGELVEVRSIDEIRSTLDRRGRNRGLSFDPEMLPYVGRSFRVLRVVERIIEESTGRLVALPGRSVILDRAVCTARYHRFCPRSVYPYWREIWLRRVVESDGVPPDG